MMLPAVLDDLVVLDLSEGIAGPLCARLLGDYGADVIKVEPPGGESGRRMARKHGRQPDCHDHHHHRQQQRSQRQRF